MAAKSHGSYAMENGTQNVNQLAKQFTYKNLVRILPLFQ